MARNDAAKRALNAALRPGDVWAEKERWLPIVLEAQRRLKATGLDRPSGFPTGGTLVLNYYMLTCNGFVKWTLRYQIGDQYVIIGGFVTEFLPENDRPRLAMKPLETHGKLVMINQRRSGESGELARPVRVLIDGDGLPVPVDPEIWAAMDLEGLDPAIWAAMGLEG